MKLGTLGLAFRMWLVVTAALVLPGCGGGGTDSGGTGSGADQAPQAQATWDLETQGIPRFVATQYIDLSRIRRISRFRSGVGHSSTDGTETCRSMKHYFEPKTDTDWATVPLYSPVQGSVRFVLEESGDAKVTIQSRDYPAFWFEVFHVRLAQPLAVGTELAAGQVLGTHVGTRTYSDVAVLVQTPNGPRLVSWFQTLTDQAWQAYSARGVPAREAFIITRAERDADPLACSGDAPFPSPGTLPNWVTLN